MKPKDRRRLTGLTVTSTIRPLATLRTTSRTTTTTPNGQECTTAANSVAASDSYTMGKIVDTILSPLVFTRYPVSILVALLYGLVFSSVLLSDSLPKVNNSKEFNQAVADLRKVREKSFRWSKPTIQLTRGPQITARPHPYLSHANDRVRSYLLSRINSVGSDIEIIDDLNSTVVYSPRPEAGVYFEGTNILVKVPGSDKHDSNAVLFSAHYDSVSTAPGATDNGISAVAALHLLE